MNFKNKALNYFNQLISSKSKHSSKRFLALYVTMFLVTFIVLVYTNSKNYLLVLGELLSFVVLLVYGSVREKLNDKKNNDFNNTKH
jgi:predicted histidine transporter YuiF (NhaC family)